MRQENNYLADCEHSAEETSMKCSVFEKSQNAICYNGGKEAKAMTPKQALKQAQARFGKDAAIDRVKNTYMVGRIVFGMMFETKGSGPSWEHALLDADNRKRQGLSGSMGLP